jgi:hypothetical protein
MILKIFITAWEFLGDNWTEIAALSALGLSVYQCVATRRHNRLSVKPHVDSHTDKGINEKGEGWLVFKLSNNGLGPALIRKFQIVQKERELSDFEPDTVKPFLAELKALTNTQTGNLTSDRALRAGEEFIVLSIKLTAEATRIQSLVDKAEEIISANFDLRMDYESIYGEKFELTPKKSG